jgi:hypothetical protein
MAKSAILELFSKEKLVSSPAMNKMGAQPFRIVAARTLRNLRPYRPAANRDFAGYSHALNQDGMVVIPDFLPADLFEQIRAESRSLVADTSKVTRQITTGPNTLFGYDFDGSLLDLKDYPAISQFYQNPNLLFLFESGLRKKVSQQNIVKWLEWLRQGEGDRKADDQTEMHSDTYYDTYKAWLYLEDITVEKAPFAYVKGTHKVESKRLRYDYANSFQPVPSPSRRITQEEIIKRNLQETVVVCKANTLAMANTFGYHRRLEGVAGFSRLALYASVRFHPFSV